MTKYISSQFFLLFHLPGKVMFCTLQNCRNLLNSVQDKKIIRDFMQHWHGFHVIFI